MCSALAFSLVVCIRLFLWCSLRLNKKSGQMKICPFCMDANQMRRIVARFPTVIGWKKSVFVL
jgi:hypothetical protein